MEPRRVHNRPPTTACQPAGTPSWVPSPRVVADAPVDRGAEAVASYMHPRTVRVFVRVSAPENVDPAKRLMPASCDVLLPLHGKYGSEL